MPPDRRTGHDGGTMTTSVPLIPTAPRLYRAVDGRMLGGVASGIAEHLGISRRWVRAAFVVLSFSAGLGVLLYGAFWIVLRTPPDAEPESPRRAAIQYVVAAVAAGITLIVNAHTLPVGWWFLPSVLACFGGALLWREASETERDRWRRLSRNSLTAGA